MLLEMLRIEARSASSSFNTRTDVCFNPVQEPQPRCLPPFALLLSSDTQCPGRALESLGLDLTGQVHGSVYSPILQRCSRTSVTTSHKPITNHFHTWLDLCHITIATHQVQFHQVVSALRVIGSISCGRNDLVCTEDELIPWPNRLATSAQSASPQELTCATARLYGCTAVWVVS